MHTKTFHLEIRPKLPKRFRRLEELANDLFYSWERDVRRLFRSLDNDCWERCEHRPKVFLRRIAQSRLDAATQDLVFIENYNRVLSAYDTYIQEQLQTPGRPLHNGKTGLTAYFCAEYGFHESFPIYSGGLGILAADYCKVMSDINYPFVALGLLYQQGYFSQTIGPHGEQIENYPSICPPDLPITPALDPAGEEIRVAVQLPQRSVEIKVWRARVGHISLFLLDSDLEANSAADRSITQKLYGGDLHMRIQQEILLGVGGVRVLRRLGLQPSVWHANEGHAAFLVLERCREFVGQGLDVSSALELVASGTVFTSHTPVSAGHDVYPAELMRSYFSGFADELGLGVDRLLQLGRDPAHPGGFNMTCLGLRGSRFHNGVSRINGRIAAEMNSHVWPEVPAQDNPFGYVTNGIHVPSFLGAAWVALFDMYFGRGWRSRMCDESFWRKKIAQIPDHVYLSTRQVLKAEMLQEIRLRCERAMRRNGVGESSIRRRVRYLDPANTGALIIGFARRFATYKRADLLFRDLQRLKRLLADPERPLLFIFAGKAHPSDGPGKQLLKQIHELSLHPELEGRLILLEDYNLSMARTLIPGVDVWLNTPRYPMEACGTSGMKAGINGVVNLSVLDGWWGEAYRPENGWSISPQDPGQEATGDDRQEATELLDVLEHEVVPLYYGSDGQGLPRGWIAKSKASMTSTLPAFNALRMVEDYVTELYRPAEEQQRRMAIDEAAGAKQLAAWKRKVEQHWDQVQLKVKSPPPREIRYGESVTLNIEATLGAMTPEDVSVEGVIGFLDELGRFVPWQTLPCEPSHPLDDGAWVFQLVLSSDDPEADLSGLLQYRIRAYPTHPLLSHRFETGRMRWL